MLLNWVLPRKQHNLINYSLFEKLERYMTNDDHGGSSNLPTTIGTSNSIAKSLHMISLDHTNLGHQFWLWLFSESLLVVNHNIPRLQLATSWWLPHWFARQNLSVKVENDYSVTMGCCDHHKCMPIAKRPNCNHMTAEMLQWLKFWGLVINLIFQCHLISRCTEGQ